MVSLQPIYLVWAASAVYWGTLEEGATMVAVKVLNLQRSRASRSFMAECKALKNVRHRNLVKVITSCSSVDFQGNDFKVLVYEFMANGSLDEWLHPVPRVDAEQAVLKNLDIPKRLNIAIDVVSVLEYLQHDSRTPIVHCDLKPSNVLMDRNMTACVGDFGLARFLPETTHVSSANQTSSLAVIGSIGYAAPEYGLGSDASTHGDIYSYGIMLLEMFTGRRPTNDVFANGLNLHKFVKIGLPEQVTRLLIQKSFRRVEKERGQPLDSTKIDHKVKDSLISIFRIGVACTVEMPRERMDINDIARELNLVKATLLGTTEQDMEEPKYT